MCPLRGAISIATRGLVGEGSARGRKTIPHKTPIRRHWPSLGGLRIVLLLKLLTLNVRRSSPNHHLAILDKDTLLPLLHTTTREVVEGSFHFSVFTFQFVNACLLWGKGHNLAKPSPRFCCLITLNRSIRNMKGGIFCIRTIKCIALCRWHILGIAIDIKEFGAITKSLIPYARHTIADSNRGQTRAMLVFTTDYYSIFYR